MKSNLIRVSMLAGIAAAAAFAQPVGPSAGNGSNAMQGVWNVNVTVVNCQNGDIIRKVRSVQSFMRDGFFSETTNSGARGSSEGIWFHVGGQNYTAAYWFFRYNSDGTFKSFAQAANQITLSPDGTQFSVTATIQDFDADNVLLSTGCVTQTATRLTAPAASN